VTENEAVAALMTSQSVDLTMKGFVDCVVEEMAQWPADEHTVGRHLHRLFRKRDGRIQCG
jgi:hypothetical protein